ncbi:SusC/RagA family TonB-linked outer membrane protein [Sphingobacterium sp. HJSM2_6]|uniref:SusC/RagA family TonB-linked outer membrane protein n=1 Tax=Sphingobacterium sp. HJSM2_6 TaxID=3366264 RepID=UPI003BCCB37B
MKKKYITKNLRYLFTGISLFLAINSWAQSSKQLSGIITNQNGGLLPGATIQLVDRQGKIIAQTATNIHGAYVLDDNQENEGYKIKVSMIGYVSYEFILNKLKDTSLDIQLVDSHSSMDEVVIIGYGQQKRGDLTTAVSSMTNVSKNAARPVTNMSEMMQGNVAGVTVMSSGGDPSARPNVIIRGMGTLNNEQPLYVVDGIPYYGGPINPNDIATIDILKDASAAAIYGAQASSGVIVITTKSGKSGVSKLNVDLYRGWQNASNLPKALNAKEYSQVYQMASDRNNLIVADGHNPTLNPWGQESRTIWMEEIFRTANILNANVQLSGGSETSRYSSSFGYHDKDGVLLNTGYKRFTYRIKSAFDLTERLSLGQNFYVNHTQARGTNTSSGYSGSIINAIYMNPAAPVYDAQGLFHGTVPINLAQFSAAYGDTYNPVALLLRPSIKNPVLNINANAFLQYTIIDGLSFKSNFAVNLDRNASKTFEPKIPEIGRSNSSNYLSHYESRENRWIWDQQLNYNKKFGFHQLDAVLVYSAQKTNYEQYNIQAMGFEREDDWYQYLENSGSIPKLPSSYAFEDALTSTIARVNYNYASRYLLSASIRNDRTSRLATKNQSDFFSAVSAAWKISSESFFNSEYINDLKLRTSWGQIGNIQSVDYYAYNLPLSNGSETPLGSKGGLERHFALTKQSNPNLLWETSETFNIGLDLEVVRKFNLTADYYRKKTLGMIWTNEADPHSGLNFGPTSNVGDVLNKGFEFTGRFNDHFGKLNFVLQGNIGINQNELLNLDGFTNQYIVHTDNVRGTLNPYRSTPGQALYSYYLIPHEGIFNNVQEIQAHQKDGKLIQPHARPGDLKFRDTNGDGRINDEDRQYMGSAIPKVTYGFSLNLEYENFDLSMLTYGISGSKVFNGYKLSTYNAGLQGYNLDARVLDAWREDKQHTNIPALSRQDANSNFGTNSDWYLENADYFRIKNITIGYAIPKLWSKLQSRVYISAENPLTFTKYSGIDPEVGRIGLDVGNYPLAKTYTIGLNINF